MDTMARVWLALCGAALQAAAQDASASLLQRVRAHMVETLARQPNYTCLETVERSNRAGKEKQFRLLDTVRLEVALVDRTEMFAWPGSKQFEDTDVRAFVPTGMFGNGEFGLYANAVFGGRSTEFEYKGEAKLGEQVDCALRFSGAGGVGNAHSPTGFDGDGGLPRIVLRGNGDTGRVAAGGGGRSHCRRSWIFARFLTRWSTSGRESAAAIFCCRR